MADSFMFLLKIFLSLLVLIPLSLLLGGCTLPTPGLRDFWLLQLNGTRMGHLGICESSGGHWKCIQRVDGTVWNGNGSTNMQLLKGMAESAFPPYILVAAIIFFILGMVIVLYHDRKVAWNEDEESVDEVYIRWAKYFFFATVYLMIIHGVLLLWALNATKAIMIKSGNGQEIRINGWAYGTIYILVLIITYAECESFMYMMGSQLISYTNVYHAPGQDEDRREYRGGRYAPEQRYTPQQRYAPQQRYRQEDEEYEFDDRGQRYNQRYVR